FLSSVAGFSKKSNDYWKTSGARGKVVYRMPHIDFASYKFTGEQAKKKANDFVFSAYRPVLIVLITLNTAVAATTAMIAAYFDPRGGGVDYISALWARLNLVLSGVPISVSGDELIDKDQPYIVMSNHQSYYDVFALIGHLPLRLKWIMKMELRKIPIFGFACEKVGHIYIDRGNSERSQKSLKAAGEKIRAGSSVVFFPEGTRSPDGKLQPFKKGGFVMALEAKVPILPVTVVGGRKILPKKSLRILPGSMKIIIHDPIPVAEYTYETKERLIKRVREVIGKDLE
ncbi:MAG: lysophospholipid acyltransferase family protein, partial [Thermodesulfobacteriota bacterium]|nr:lysophospholipid acyltransferase family protein [Thermodesulfobacteriota bacterium]